MTSEGMLKNWQRNDTVNSCCQVHDANPNIVRCFNETSLDPMKRQGDETPWCAAFVNWCLETAGFGGAHNPMARFFAAKAWGVEIDEPKVGCIAVFGDYDAEGTLKSSGHVGFVVSWDANSVQLLGGNQSNTVNIATYLLEKHEQGRLVRKLLCHKFPAKN